MRFIGVYFYRVSYLMRDKSPEPDMLRYDCAFVNPDFPNIVAFPVFRDRTGGTGGGKPNFERWRSFCQNLVPLSEEQEREVTFSIEFEPQKWATRTHPVKGQFGPTDYGQLVPASLDLWMQAKTWMDVLVRV